MPPQFIFTMRELHKVAPLTQREILRGISLAFYPDAKIGVLGPNGAGKSTLLRIMAGLDTEFSGYAHITEGFRAGLLAQEPLLDAQKDVRGNVEDGVAAQRAVLDRYNVLSMRLAEELAAEELERVTNELQRTQDEIEAKSLWDLDTTVDVAMDALRCPPGDQDVRTLSGGERRRVALCRLLLARPDLLLLDEPTNHLDAESVAWLERHLVEYPGCVVAVTHDRYFLDNAAGWILELDRGFGIPYQGNYSSWLEQKRARLSVEEKQESARQKTLARELEWVRASPRARQAKSKARIESYERLLAEDPELRERELEISIPPGPRLGDVVVEATKLRKAYGDKLLFDGLTFSLPRGAIVGIIGPNGAGKTTLFRLITGEERPDGGTLRVGETVKLAYVSQTRDTLDPAKNVWEEISGGQESIQVGTRLRNARAYAASFNFRGADQQKKVGDLSGGERNRVHLAKLLRSGGNVLLLDEPTNDLDVDTLRALEEALLDFAGCVAVISHDRWFLDRVATHMLVFEGDSSVRWFEGNYRSYEEHMRSTIGADWRPHRIRYRPLTRA
ncbi:MAG: energy-dependent translational throttle protein EttA [Chloroflexi bacterium]|nr:MAG: energy-dependent translational throttle protein EttA [Chloroflexota bacterium]TMG69930.1 MAG: energy-dependent translational throttle protein EttA [Chloroflexota bacterium]